MSSNGQHNNEEDKDLEELKRIAEEYDEEGDFLLEQELERQGGQSFDPSKLDPDHPLLSDLNKKYDTTNYWQGAYSRHNYGNANKYHNYSDSWKFTPVKSASQYIRDSYWGGSYYKDDYYTVTKSDAANTEALHEVLKELNKTINLTSNSNDTSESFMIVRFSNGAMHNDLRTNTLYVSPNVMLDKEGNIKTGDDYYSSLDGLNGQAMLCSFMRRNIDETANEEYKACEKWGARNIFMTDLQSSAATEIFTKWPGFMSYITSQMQVFGVQKDYITGKFNNPMLCLDDLIEALCYNRLGSDKVDYTVFHPDIVKKMLLADRDFNEMLDTPCKPDQRFQKAERVYKAIVDIMNLPEVELNVKLEAAGIKLGDDIGDASKPNQIDMTDSPVERNFTGDNSFNNKVEVDGDIVFNILDHNKKLRERLKELADAYVSDLKEEKTLQDQVYKLLIPPVNVETINKYDEFVNNNKKRIDSIKDSLMFHNNIPYSSSYGLTDGELDEHALYKIHLGEYERLFERKDMITEKGYHITVVIDQSGSMKGERLEEANKLCILFAEALKFLRKTEYSIYGFETRDINTWVYKDKIYNKQKALISADAHGGTAMGFHLGIIGDKVVTQYPEYENKFMFVITDGQPTHGSNQMPSVEHTAHTIKLLHKRGIKVFGIGILNAFDQVTGTKIFGDGNFVVINDIAGSLSVLTHKLRKYLQKASKI